MNERVWDMLWLIIQCRYVCQDNCYWLASAFCVCFVVCVIYLNEYSIWYFGQIGNPELPNWGFLRSQLSKYPQFGPLLEVTISCLCIFECINLDYIYCINWFIWWFIFWLLCWSICWSICWRIIWFICFHHLLENNLDYLLDYLLDHIQD